ncbi:AMP-binding protein [Paraburkholderia acidisoli]|uniref:Long-chain-fatty-acid--CoA ligase n=1 Tax=Paraburkholderia acidisoli TaxID=2571748 RepID=A0A7Z2JDW8_9BURK|nr:AMP-binding protein [Paraburkholderia acidisoli]QGZ61687.1 AMP-binding protein [Paraburkholderia acidisoli]
MSDTPLPDPTQSADPALHSAAGVPADATRAPDTDGIWYASYPPGVPHEIDAHFGTGDGAPAATASLARFFDDCTTRFRDRVAYVSAGSPMTYGTLARQATAFASWLQNTGIAPGERVAIMLPNTLQYPVALFGALKAGAVVVNVNPLYTARELAHQLQDSGARLIVVFENFAATLEKALPGTQVEHVVVTALGDLLGEGLNLKGRFINFMLRHVKKMVPPYHLPHAVALLDALERGVREPRAPVTTQADDLAFLQYTGGTTGVAKGAMLTHGNVLANVQQAKAWVGTQFDADPNDPAARAETVLTPLPLYHIYSLTVNAFIFMALGGRNILIANPRDVPRVMKILRHESFSCISAVNTLYAALLDNDTFRARDFSGLKLAMAGGMATQHAVAERFRAVTGKPIVEGYGLTECSPIVAMNPVDVAHLAEFAGSIGLPAPSTRVRLRRDDGTWANIGETGEVCVQGPQVMRGYWNRPDETAGAFVNGGWFATGDIGVMDARGFIRLIDRKKDMILVSGFNVYPNEIEDVLTMHPGVREAAAVGVPDARQGERVKVFVVKRDPALTEDAVIAFCREHLTAYKVPRLVEFRAALPQTNIGKILRRELRDEEIAKLHAQEGKKTPS